MNNTIRTLLKDEPKALKALNEVFGFDYCQPFQAFFIEGKTTINKILKEITIDNPFIIVLSKGGRVFPNEWSVIELSDSGNINLDFKQNYFHARYLRKFNTKGDFRDSLKSEDYKHIIFAQDKQHLRPCINDYEKNRLIDLSQRFKIPNDNSISWYSYKCEPYITSVVLTTESGGKSFSYKPAYSIDTRPHNINDIIDKSGYLISYHRGKLWAATNNLKSQRAKAAYLSTDHTQKIEELKIRIQAKKLELIELLKRADSYEDYKTFAKKVDDWHGFCCIIDSFSRLLERIDKDYFDSNESFERNYNQISEMLLNI